MDAYRHELAARRDPTANRMSLIFGKLKNNPQRMIFAEGEDEKVIRAAVQWRDNKYGTPILVGREQKVKERHEAHGREGHQSGIIITNASLVDDLEPYIDQVYKPPAASGLPAAAMRRAGEERPQHLLRGDAAPTATAMR